MILFFDRSVGTAIPLALIQYLKPRGVTIEYHEKHFSPEALDDEWLPEVGKRGWFVIGQDHNYHNRSPELEAIKEYGIGAFYLWGTEVEKWETLRCFARGYDNILHRASVTPTPFIFKVEKHGGLNEVYFI